MADTPKFSDLNQGVDYEQAFAQPQEPQRAPAALPEPQPDIQVNVVNPEGKLVSIPSAQLHEAINSGYSQASPEMVERYHKEQKYGTIGQQAITGLEGAASAGTFGLSTGLETAAGIAPEDITARREVNPGVHALGQVAGLGASALAAPEMGALGVLGKAGQAGAEVVGLAKPVSTLAKIGSGATKMAIENAIFQGGDEVSKMLASDPNQSVSTAAASVGLGGLIGAGFGAAGASISPLWKATIGRKTDGVLRAISNKLGGIEGVVSQPIEDAVKMSGIDIKPDVLARLSSDPEIQQLSKVLEQTDTNGYGLEHQASLNAFRKDASDSMVRALGKDPEALENVELSKYEVGKKLGNTLAQEYEAQLGPTIKEFEAIKDKYSDLKLPINSEGTITERIGELANKEGWTASPSSDIMKEVNRVIKEIPLQKTVKDLDNYITAIGHNMQSDPLNGPLRRAGGMIKSILKDTESELISKEMGAKEGLEAKDRYDAVRKEYAKQSTLKDQLDSRLNAKGSTSGYGKSLKEMAQTDGEALLRRMSGKNDANLLEFLQQNYPQTAQLLKQYHLDDILNSALAKAKPGETINSGALRKALGNMQPELRDFVVPKEAMSKVDAVSQLLDQLDKVPHNTSNTARAMGGLMKHIPGSAVGLATILTGHNPATAAITGIMTNYIGKTVPDAIRLSLLKFLGSAKPIEPGAFKSMVNFIDSTIKGENLINKASKSIFKEGGDIFPKTVIPDEGMRKKLDKRISKLNEDPSKMFDMAGETGHYMEEHAASIGQIATTAMKYLAMLKPNTEPRNPLDAKVPPNSTDTSKYNRALDIAQQPLLVLKSIKDGSLSGNDIIALKSMYPALYSKLVGKLTNDMVTAKDKETDIPYKTRMALSLFMGQPLDSTLTPDSIASAQVAISTPRMQKDAQQPTGTMTKYGSEALAKLPGSYKTGSQSAEEKRASTKV